MERLVHLVIKIVDEKKIYPKIDAFVGLLMLQIIYVYSKAN